mmetsp:Transcript_50552/g.120569  ORF Transcript_50552/g.120569 Transcript_50552/m.120569 type:complete len:219 (-) Transcript_50552:43-699(-)
MIRRSQQLPAVLGAPCPSSRMPCWVGPCNCRTRTATLPATRPSDLTSTTSFRPFHPFRPCLRDPRSREACFGRSQSRTCHLEARPSARARSREFSRWQTPSNVQSARTDPLLADYVHEKEDLRRLQLAPCLWGAWQPYERVTPQNSKASCQDCPAHGPEHPERPEAADTSGAVSRRQCCARYSSLCFALPRIRTRFSGGRSVSCPALLNEFVERQLAR